MTITPRINLTYYYYDSLSNKMLLTGYFRSYTLQEAVDLFNLLPFDQEPERNFVLCRTDPNQLVFRGGPRFFQQVTGRPLEPPTRYWEYTQAYLNQMPRKARKAYRLQLSEFVKAFHFQYPKLANPNGRTNQF